MTVKREGKSLRRGATSPLCHKAVDQGSYQRSTSLRAKQTSTYNTGIFTGCRTHRQKESEDSDRHIPSPRRHKGTQSIDVS